MDWRMMSSSVSWGVVGCELFVDDSAVVDVVIVERVSPD
jgi:hypothetical protein